MGLCLTRVMNRITYLVNRLHAIEGSVWSIQLDVRPHEWTILTLRFSQVVITSVFYDVVPDWHVVVGLRVVAGAILI